MEHTWFGGRGHEGWLWAGLLGEKKIREKKKGERDGWAGFK
jgi:hypothetical protein